MEQKSKATTFLLCFFLGGLGVHRFYLDRLISGVFMLLTGGGLGIWWLIDCYLVASGRLRDEAGNALRTSPPDPNDPHAGFWVRLAALSVDGLILAALYAVVGIVAAFAVPVLTAAGAGGQRLAAVSGFVVSLGLIAASLLYFAALTASDRQATIGKRAFDICVTTTDETRVGLLRALWRSLAYAISALPLCLGFVMAVFQHEGRALHDLLAGTKVMYKSSLSAQALEAAPGEQTALAAALPEPVQGAGARGPVLTMALGAALLAAAIALALS